MGMTIYDDAAATADYGKPTAAKRGRNPKFPYVPVIDYGRHTTQIRGLAYVTRDEAVAAAQHHIDAAHALLARKLADPRHRLLREQYGVTA